jgi:hypothetical protein
MAPEDEAEITDEKGVEDDGDAFGGISNLLSAPDWV